MVFIKSGLVAGGLIGRSETRGFYAPPPARSNKNRKKCDETAKKRDELVTGAVFRVEKAAAAGTRQEKSLADGLRKGPSASAAADSGT